MGLWDELSDGEEIEPTPKPKKKVGRPAGRRNTPKQGTPAATLHEQGQKVLDVIGHLLTSEQRQYYTRLHQGLEPYDPIRSLEIFQILTGVFATKLVADAILNDDGPSKELAEVSAQYRMGNKDYFDMKRREDEIKRNNANDESMDDPTREPALDRIEAIIGGIAKS